MSLQISAPPSLATINVLPWPFCFSTFFKYLPGACQMIPARRTPTANQQMSTAKQHANINQRYVNS
jgi:hypothetical protein